MKDSDKEQGVEARLIKKYDLVNLYLFAAQVILISILLLYYTWIGLVFTAIAITYKLFKEIFSSNDIIIFIKGLLQKRSIKIFLIILMLTTSVFLFILNNLNNIKKTERVNPRYFGGLVWDVESEPLSGVIIFLPELNLIDTTDEKGRFSFTIADTNFITISLVAQKDGYDTYDAEGSVGNMYYNFVMLKR
jgi:hypothetical protein